MPYNKRITTLSDPFLIELMNEGHLRMTHTDTPNPRCFITNIRGKTRELKATVCGTKGLRYRFEICREGKRRSVIRAKLVYLYITRQPIPPNHELHHLDEDRFNDSFQNLKALPIKDHLAHHRPRKANLPSPPSYDEY